MGLFSFLFGGKPKKAAADGTTASAAPVAPAPAVAPGASLRADPSNPVAAMAAPIGVEQMRLRLKLAASLRKGEHAVAYEAACSLADIQVRAGRRMSARVWTVEADRILEQMET